MFVASLFALAIAQSGSAPLALPANQWTVDYSRTACTLARRVGGEGSPIVAFNAPFGSEPGELVVLEAGSALRAGLDGEVQVRLDDGPAITVRARPEERSGRPLLRLGRMPEDFLDRVAGARQLTVTKANQPLIVLPLANARGAIEELTRCNDDLLRSWGIDVAARRALSRKARARSFDWAAGVMPAASTFLVLTADISERGRATSCRVVVSSRNERMDRAVCRLVQNEAHFEPALDAQGRPVAAQYVTQIRWVIDQDDS
jgi:TonB family protein